MVPPAVVIMCKLELPACLIDVLRADWLKLGETVQDGVSAAFVEVMKFVGKVAATTLPIMITGESGTGKEIVARAIHCRSLRAARPFVAVNCGAIPSELIESELFGHTRGSFTGATADRRKESNVT